MSIYSLAAGGVLVMHLAWILWVAFGSLLARSRRWMARLHVASLVYGVVITLGPWPCPLTVAETWLQAKAGIAPYQGGFLIHYLEKLVYPEVPPALLAAAVTGVCLLNLTWYARRYRNPRWLR